MGAAVIKGVSDADYHRLPGLSGSGVHKLLSNPRTFREPVATTEAMRLGTAFHALELGTDMPLEWADKGATLKGKAAAEWATECDERGVIPMLQAWESTLNAMTEAVNRNVEAAPLLTGPGGSEVGMSAEWNGVPVRGKADRLLTFAEGLVIADLKTGASLTERDIYDRGYDVQVFMYERLACEVFGMEPAAAPYLVHVSTGASPACQVWQFDDVERADAYARIDLAVDLYAACVERDEWPDWAERGIRRPSIPTWTQRARLAAEDAATEWLDMEES